MITIETLLLTLASDWLVDLKSKASEWLLTITNKRRGTSFTYEGTLTRVICAASAGVPGGRV